MLCSTSHSILYSSNGKVPSFPTLSSPSFTTPKSTCPTSVNRHGAHRSTDVGHVGLGGLFFLDFFFPRIQTVFSRFFTQLNDAPSCPHSKKRKYIWFFPRLIVTLQYQNSNFGYIFTTDCTDYTDFSSQEATMAGCRTIRMAGAAEAQKSV